jgi:hypothetical protein
LVSRGTSHPCGFGPPLREPVTTSLRVKSPERPQGGRDSQGKARSLVGPSLGSFDREAVERGGIDIRGRIDAAAGARVIAAVAGGINKTARVEIRDRMLFAKWNDRGLRAHFSAEAAGLEALRAADSGLRVPTVIAHRDEPATEAFLLLEHIENVNRPAEFDETLGRGLARLHRTSSRQGFGFACDTYCGATRQINAWYTDWIDFFRDERLAAQVQLARHRGMSRVDAALCDRLLA